MRIALLTWFHYVNYGTALQVYAFYRYLTSRGYDVRVIKYYPPTPHMYYKSKWDEVMYRSKRKLHFLMNSPEILMDIATKGFQEFLKNNICFTETIRTDEDLNNLNTDFDAFICGSDQIWSPLNFNSHYYLDFVYDNAKMISYAPSFGVSKVENLEYKEKIGALTARFTNLSVREKTGMELIHKINGRKATVVLDPTLLLSSYEWNSILPDDSIKEQYLLVYFLRENRRYWEVVFKIAVEKKLNIWIIPIVKNDLKRDGRRLDGIFIRTLKNVTPNKFVNLIRNASYICTDSFHGMAFSVNFNKQFLPFQRFSTGEKDDQNSRVIDFLDDLGLLERLYRKKNVNDTEIDYSMVNKKLLILREQSEEFLNGALNGIEYDDSRKV